MSLFITVIWGTKARTRPVGVRAAFCPGCLDVRKVEVHAIEKSDHVYLIPLGGWKENLRYQECEVCHAQRQIASEARLLAVDEAEKRTAREILEATNSPEELDAQRRAETSAQNLPPETRKQSALGAFLAQQAAQLKRSEESTGGWAGLLFFLFIAPGALAFVYGGLRVGIGVLGRPGGASPLAPVADDPPLGRGADRAAPPALPGGHGNQRAGIHGLPGLGALASGEAAPSFPPRPLRASSRRTVIVTFCPGRRVIVLVVQAFALFLLLAAGAGDETMEALLQKLRSDEPDLRAAAAAGILDAWSRWKDEDLARLDQAGADKDPELSGRAREARVRIRIRRTMGATLFGQLPNSDLAFSSGDDDAKLTVLHQAKTIWKTGKIQKEDLAGLEYVATHARWDDASTLDEFLKQGEREADVFDSRGRRSPRAAPGEGSGTARRRGAEAQRQVAEFLGDSAPEVRTTALRVMGGLQARELAPHVAMLLQDRNAGVRGEALEPARRLGRARIRPRLRQNARRSQPDASASGRRSCWAPGGRRTPAARSSSS
jgi:hypothetical protein